jgi:hypothetical protein
MLPWFKADTDAIIDGMLDFEWSSPAPFYLAALEWQAIVAAGRADKWSHPRLAKRWMRPVCWVRRLKEQIGSQANRRQIADASQDDSRCVADESQADSRLVAGKSQGRSSSGRASGDFLSRAIAGSSQADSRLVAGSSQDDSREDAASRARILDPKILDAEKRLEIEIEIRDKTGDADAPHQQQHPLAAPSPVAVSQPASTEASPSAQPAPATPAPNPDPAPSVKRPTRATGRLKKAREQVMAMSDLPPDVRARVEPALARLQSATRIGVRVGTGERLDLQNPVLWLSQMAVTYPHLDLALEVARADAWLTAKQDVRASARAWFCGVWLPRARPAPTAPVEASAQPTLGDLVAAARQARVQGSPEVFGAVYGRLWARSGMPMTYAKTVLHEPRARDCPCWGCLDRLGWWPGPKAWTNRPVSGDDPRAMQGAHVPMAQQLDGPWIDE